MHYLLGVTAANVIIPEEKGGKYFWTEDRVTNSFLSIYQQFYYSVSKQKHIFLLKLNKHIENWTSDISSEMYPPNFPPDC